MKYAFKYDASLNNGHHIDARHKNIFVKLPVPDTSNVYWGLVLFIPTYPILFINNASVVPATNRATGCEVVDLVSA